MTTVLLVEDNPTNADMMQRLLHGEGFEVEHHVRGLDGVKAARSRKFDIILMDFNLPDFDGRNLVLTIKRQLGRTSPPIVAVTARSGPVEEKIARRFGCDAFIAKPFDSQVFVDTINEVLERAKTN